MSGSKTKQPNPNGKWANAVGESADEDESIPNLEATHAPSTGDTLEQTRGSGVSEWPPAQHVVAEQDGGGLVLSFSPAFSTGV